MGQPFSEYMAAVKSIYSHWLVMPSLFISSMDMFQGEPSDTKLTADLEASPFYFALSASDHFSVVRSSTVDVYKRAWCVLEMVYAHRIGMYPEKVHMGGPDGPADAASSLSQL